MYIRTNLGNYFFYFSFFLWYFHKVVKMTFFDTFFSDEFLMNISFVATLLLIVKIVIIDYKFFWKYYLKISLVVSICFISVASSGKIWYDSLFTISLFVIAAHDISLKKICLLTSALAFAALVTVLVTNHLGIISKTIVFEPRHRDALGFKHYSNAPFVFLGAVFSGMYAKHEKKELSYLELLILLLINLYIYIKTDTRWIFVSVFAIVFLYVIIYKFNLYYYLNKNKKMIAVLSVFFVTSILIIYFAVSIKYSPNSTIFHNIDIKLFNTRISLNNRAFKEYGIHFWGNEVKYIDDGKDFFYIDSGYMQLLFNNGLIVLIMICVAYYIIMINAVKEENWFVFSWVIIIVIFNVMNEMIFTLERATPLLLLFQIICKEKLVYEEGYKSRKYKSRKYKSLYYCSYF